MKKKSDKNNRLSKFNTQKVLFVCNGNIFRSFSAEILLKRYLDIHKMHGWEIFSAGIRVRKEDVDPKVITKLQTLGIKDINHKQHKLTKSMLKNFDLIVAMAEDQIDFMKNKFNFTDAVLFNKLANNEESSIWDIGDDVKDFATNRRGVEKKIDNTIQYIYDNIPKLVEGIIQYLKNKF